MIKWLHKKIIPECLGYYEQSYYDPKEFNCGYEFGGDCGDCLCNGGIYNPVTGQKSMIRYYLSNILFNTRKKFYKNIKEYVWESFEK